MRGIAVVTAVVWVLCGGLGCTGCEQRMFDEFDNWLRHDPERAGKVGILRGLEVAQTAVDNIDQRRARGAGPCAIGWDVDESFALAYDFEIEVDHPRRTRHWAERGEWTQDGDGRWLLEADVEFEDGGELTGGRTVRLFSGREGFWEWMGPEVVARYRSRSAAERHWYREYRDRFATLVGVVSEGWQKDGDRRLVPGGDRPPLCGPGTASDDRRSWRAMLDTRATLEAGAIIAGPAESGVSGECRQLDATYRLGTVGELSMRFRECLQEPSEAVERPEIDGRVDVGRSVAEAEIAKQLDRWLEQQLVAPGEGAIPE